MKLFQKKLLVLLSSISMVLFLGACSDSATTEIDNFGPGKERAEVATSLEGDQFDLLQQASEEYLKNLDLETVSSDEVYEMVMLGSEEEFQIVDVRDSVTFANGHIDGAINIPYALTANLNLIEHLPKDKKLIVVCYSGHTASQAATLWNMLGYETVIMENGMGSWTSDTTLASAIPTSTMDFEVVKEASTANATHDLPALSVEGVTDLPSLLAETSKQYMTSGKKTIITAADLKEKLDNNDSSLFLVDIRDAQDYAKGHIADAINIPFSELASKDNLAKLPTDKKVVLIGYDGYDASQATRVLNQLEYDAITMFAGMRIWHSDRLLTGIDPISSEKLADFPTIELKFNLGGEAAAAG